MFSIKKVYLNQINSINKENFFHYYFLVGSDSSLLQAAKEKIFEISKKRNFFEKKTFFVSSNFNWDEIFLLLKNENVFNIKTIVLIIIKNEKKMFTLEKNIKKMFDLLTKKNILIIQCENFSINKVNEILKNKKKLIGILIFCYFLNELNKKLWIEEKLKNIDLKFSKNIKKNYQDNLYLSKKKMEILNFFNLKNKKISLENIDNLLINQKEINPILWSDAILNGDQKKSIKIINMFLFKEYNPIPLIRSFQKDLLILIKYFFQNKKLTFFLKEEKINNNRFIYFSNFLKRNNIKKLYFSIKLLTEIEITIKSNQKIFFVWSKLQYLSTYLS